MNINEVGMTAFVISYLRALERERPQPLFEDASAAWFVPDEIRETAEKFHRLIPEAGDLIRYRTCHFHDLLRREIENGVRQVVILGAGFDMRPLTFRTEGVMFYDVDQPAVMEYKHKVLEQHGVPPWPCVPCNYLEVDLVEKLTEAGFDSGASTLFIWEGNTMYLPLDRIYGFIGQLRRGVASLRIAFDYFSPRIIDRTSGLEGVTHAADFFEHNLGAPWITGFDDVRVLEHNTGLAIAESGEMLDLGKKYAPEDAQNLAKFAGLYSYCLLTK